MKTPRDILFERHQAAEPALDAIRQQTLASLTQKRSASALQSTPRWRAVLSTLNLQLSTFLWPSPYAWAGAAAAWMLVLALNLSASRGSDALVVALSPSPPAAVVKMASTERRLLMNSLLDLSLSETATPPSPPIAPRPHSERRADRICA